MLNAPRRADGKPEPRHGPGQHAEPPGMYVVNVTVGEQRFTQRLVMQ